MRRVDPIWTKLVERRSKDGDCRLYVEPVWKTEIDGPGCTYRACLELEDLLVRMVVQEAVYSVYNWKTYL